MEETSFFEKLKNYLLILAGVLSFLGSLAIIAFLILNNSNKIEDIELINTKIEKLNLNLKDDYVFLNKTWTLTSFNDLNPDFSITIKFEENNKVSGFGGCNDYTAKFEINEDSFNIYEINKTKMFCENVSVVENAFFQVLELVNKIEVSDDTLTLSSQNNKLVFKKEK
ncbi:MAG: hypothetical protein KatS3mg085_592 [Candidatus Dojkabacteria bacterium]|nr:MAG: hypothetical protein KatS3mg085_592 [Candidatus Dojkabacteria bacterium]